MSFASGGVVYTSTTGTAGAPAQEARYGLPVTQGAIGSVVPAGTWISTGAVNIISADGTTHQITGGWITSDGVNVTSVAASNVIIPVGKR